MKTFQVGITVNDYKVIEVEANSADDAYDKADELLNYGMVVFDNADYADVNIEVIEEVMA